MSDVQHLTLGKSNAPVTVESFINFACPYCKNYFKAADSYLTPLIEQGKVKHVIKHFDKTKQGLLKGTIANFYLDYEDVSRTYQLIHHLYETQESWKTSFSAIERKMEDEFNLALNKAADERSLAITAEAFERGITGIPTVFIDGEKFVFNPLGDDEVTLVEKLREQLTTRL